MRSIILAILFSLGLGTTAVATQPACTGDRHYDGVGCCPIVTPPQECEPCEECKPVLPCPDPPPCPTVECKDGKDGETTFVEVACPAYVPEVLEVGKVRRDGTVLLPRSKKARKNGNGGRRIYVPRSLIDKIEQQGY